MKARSDRKNFGIVLVAILASTSVGGLALAWHYWEAAERATRRLAELSAGEVSEHAPVEAGKAAVPPSVPMVVRAELRPEREAELQAEISLLHDELARKDKDLDDLRQRTNRGRRSTDGAEGTQGGGNRFNLENLRHQDPTRYAEFQQRIQTFREQARAGLDKQRDFFAKVSAEGLGEEQAAAHNKLIELLDENQDIMDLMGQEQDSAVARELRRKLFENSREVSGLMATERQIVLQDMAGQLGYQGASAVQFAEYLNHVYDITSPLGFGGFGGRGGNSLPPGARPPSNTRAVDAPRP